MKNKENLFRKFRWCNFQRRGRLYRTRNKKRKLVLGTAVTALAIFIGVDFIATSAGNSTNVKTKDITLWKGDTWKKENNFVSATDKAGKVVSLSSVTVRGSVDTSKPGTYEVDYSCGGKSAKAIIKVKDLLTPVINVKDSILNLGDTFTPSTQNFVSATDNHGNVIPWSVMVSNMTMNVDVNTIGTYDVTFTYQGVNKTARVDVTYTNVPIDMGDGTVIFANQKWDVIKNMGNGNKLIAMQNKIGDSTFNAFSQYFSSDTDNLEGYSDSLVKPMIDQ